MSGDTSTIEHLLKRPLYLFSLPQQLLNTLHLKSFDVGDHQEALNPKDARAESSSEDAREPATEIASATSCSLCRVQSASVQEQRDHIRSDHHRYNLRARLRGVKILNEAEFNSAIGDLDESISGSDDESSDNSEEESEDATTLAALLKKQATLTSKGHDDDDPSNRHDLSRQAVVWFGSSSLPTVYSLGVYRGLFPAPDLEKPAQLVDTLKRRQCPAIPAKNASPSTVTPSSKTPHHFLCMIGGGHFAAMIVSLAPVLHIRAGGVEEYQPFVLAHKTFHRYTTRRKQGGAQSAMDNAKGVASTAGSSLRRYNEVALQTDVRNVLSEWRQWIDTADFIFVRATGNTNRRVLFGPYPGQVLKHDDKRVRGIPFTTKRPTQSELMRVFTELTTVKVSRVDKTAAVAAAERSKKEAAQAEAERLRKSAQRKAKETKKLSVEEEERVLHTTQIQALIRRSKIPALLSYISKNSIPPNFSFYPTPSAEQDGQASSASSHSHTPTPLHLAASSGSPQVVDALLLKAKLDPTFRNIEGKTPFEVSADRQTREAFRVARHELGEDAWDWSWAGVPSPLVREEVQSRKAAEKLAADEAERQRRTAEVERLRKEEETRKATTRERKFGEGKVMAPLEKTWTEKREEETRGMTPEMRARLERERRARAAEERIKRMQQRGR